jgi:hypothetical protein
MILFGEDPLDALRAGWKRFCELLKYETRFFLDRYPVSTKYPESLNEGYSPGQMLYAIGDRIVRMELSKRLDQGTKLYRVRRCKENIKLASPAELGPPDHTRAVMSNRMSPPGIVMIYAALDPETALAETVDEKGGLYAIAELSTRRPAHLLDLTRLPSVPGFFELLPDTQPWSRRDAQFFRDLVSDFSRPIARDDRVHIEYVPTQVFTEYCRLALHRDYGSQPFEGILYPSARNTGHAALVLFADRRAVSGATDDDSSAWIDLATVEYKSIGMT